MAEAPERTPHSVREGEDERLGQFFVSRVHRAGDRFVVADDLRRYMIARDLLSNFEESGFYGVEDAVSEFGEDDDEDDDDFFHDIDDLQLNPPNRPIVLPYPSNPEKLAECAICFETKTVRPRICCDLLVCTSCVVDYLESQVQLGNVKIQCPQTSCSSYVHRDEVRFLLPDSLKERYNRFLVAANQSPHDKTCPRCSQVRSLTPEEVTALTRRRSKLRKQGLEVVCQECGLHWCFLCQAPWHTKMTCREFTAGDKLLKEWSHQYNFGQLNAQKCPKCKIFIQRTTGCDQMTCSKCKTIFCYRCGQRFVGVKLIGNHFSRYSPLGCKYNFLPERPAARRFIRGAAMGGKLLGGIVLGGLAVVGGVLLLGASVVILPAYGGYRLHKRRRRRRHTRRLHQRHLEQQTQNHWNAFLQRTRENVQDESELDVSQEVQLGEDDLFDDDDLAGDESREGRTFTEIGLQLQNSHLTLLRRKSDSQPGRFQAEELTDGNVVITTEVEEEADEDGYPRVVAHIISNPINKSKGKKESAAGAGAGSSAGRREAGGSSAGSAGSAAAEKEKKEKEGEASSSSSDSFSSNLPEILPVTMENIRSLQDQLDNLAKRKRQHRRSPLVSDLDYSSSSKPHLPSSSSGKPAASASSASISPSESGESDLDDFLPEIHDYTFETDVECEEESDEEEEEEEEAGSQPEIVLTRETKVDETQRDGDCKKGLEGKKTIPESKKDEDGRLRDEDTSKTKPDENRKTEEGKKKEDGFCKETKGEKDPGGEAEEDDDEKETKGCFTHLIVRKLSSLQVGVGDGTSSGKGQANGVKVVSLNHRKSATWEKRSQRKDSRSGNDFRSLDIRALLFQAEKLPDHSQQDTDLGEAGKAREGEAPGQEGGNEWKKLEGKSVSEGSFPPGSSPPPGSDGGVLPTRSQCRMYVSPCDVVTHL